MHFSQKNFLTRLKVSLNLPKKEGFINHNDNETETVQKNVLNRLGSVEVEKSSNQSRDYNTEIFHDAADCGQENTQDSHNTIPQTKTSVQPSEITKNQKSPRAKIKNVPSEQVQQQQNKQQNNLPFINHEQPETKSPRKPQHCEKPLTLALVLHPVRNSDEISKSHSECEVKAISNENQKEVILSKHSIQDKIQTKIENKNESLKEIKFETAKQEPKITSSFQCEKKQKRKKKQTLETFSKPATRSTTKKILENPPCQTQVKKRHKNQKPSPKQPPFNLNENQDREIKEKCKEKQTLELPPTPIPKPKPKPKSKPKRKPKKHLDQKKEEEKNVKINACLLNLSKNYSHFGSVSISVISCLNEGLFRDRYGVSSCDVIASKQNLTIIDFLESFNGIFGSMGRLFRFHSKPPLTDQFVEIGDIFQFQEKVFLLVGFQNQEIGFQTVIPLAQLIEWNFLRQNWPHPTYFSQERCNQYLLLSNSIWAGLFPSISNLLERYSYSTKSGDKRPDNKSIPRNSNSASCSTSSSSPNKFPSSIACVPLIQS